MTDDLVTIQFQKPYLYEWCLFGDWYAFTVRSMGKPPGFFHTFMLKHVLGIHVRKII